MALCDELEARQEKRHDRILQLGEVATSQLLTPSTPEAFNQHWQGICDNFDLLYSTPENVSQLRQAILQLAVMGKLVPQDANDEPASALLERIKEEKARLVKEGKIKKSEKLPPVDVNEMPFELPNGWGWVKIGNLLREPLSNGKSVPTQEGGFPVLRLSALRGRSVDLADFKEGAWTADEAKSWLVEQGDYFIARGNGSINLVGRGALVVESIHKPIAFPDTMIRMRVFPNALLPSFLSYLWNNQVIRSQIEQVARTTSGIFKISQEDIRETIVCLPPLGEQKRIVVKVDHLMSLCDELEAKLTQSISNREKLMETAVRQVFAA